MRTIEDEGKLRPDSLDEVFTVTCQVDAGVCCIPLCAIPCESVCVCGRIKPVCCWSRSTLCAQWAKRRKRSWRSNSVWPLLRRAGSSSEAVWMSKILFGYAGQGNTFLALRACSLGPVDAKMLLWFHCRQVFFQVLHPQLEEHSDRLEELYY